MRTTPESRFDDALLRQASSAAFYDRCQLLGDAALLATDEVPRSLAGNVEFFRTNRVAAIVDVFKVDVVVRNALLESFATRARCLYEFFYRPQTGPDAKRPYVRAADFFDDGARAWAATRDRSPVPYGKELDEVWDRASALAAHISPGRLALVAAQNKSWPFAHLAIAVEHVWQLFVHAAPDHRLDASARESRRSPSRLDDTTGGQNAGPSERRT